MTNVVLLAGTFAGCLLVASCGGGASFALRAPVADRCRDAGAKACDELTDGVLAYVDGDKAGATKRLQRAALEGDSESIRRLSASLRLAAGAPGLEPWRVQLTDIATLLDAAAPRATVVSAAGEAKAEARPTAQGPSEDARTKTVTAIVSGHPRAYTCAPLGKSTQAYAGSTCVRLGIGALVVTDVVTSAACPGDILLMAGAAESPAWIVATVPPRERFSMHDARLVVAPEDELVVAVHGAAPLARDASCGVTISTRRP